MLASSEGAAAHPPKNRPQSPNVLLIMTDDQGWDDLGIHGNLLLNTPRLDTLASQSVQFDNYYVTPVCATSRASLLTGRHFLRTGVSHVHGGKDYVHPDEKLMPQYFKEAGYVTGMWGKWHSGRTKGYFPWERGFDTAYSAELYHHRDSFGLLDGEPVVHEGWTVDILTDYAVDFISRHRNQPWFAFVPYLTIHAPLLSKESLIESYMKKGMGRQLATIYAMTEQMDTNIGSLLDTLDELELADNTIVVFMSDNGPQFFGDMPEKDLKTRYVNHYKGHKGSIWENGIKSPLFIRWPDHFKPHTAERLTDICDILPTLLDLCNVPDGDHLPFDGRSVRSYLEGNESTLPPKESVIFSDLGWPPQKNEADTAEAWARQYQPVEPGTRTGLRFEDQLMVLRTETNKFLWRPGFAPGAPASVDGQVLIDIINDAKENHNLAASQSQTAALMREQCAAWFDSVKNSDHAYHLPIFEIEPDRESPMFLFGMHRVRGSVINSYVWIEQGFQNVGDGADYGIRVPEPGRYAVRRDVHEWSGRPVTVEMKVAGQRIPFVWNEGECSVVVDLPAGTHALSLDVIDADLSKPEGKAAVTMLMFKKID